jgi:hypothetical protein
LRRQRKMSGMKAGVRRLAWGLVERRRRRKKIGWIAIPGCQAP